MFTERQLEFRLKAPFVYRDPLSRHDREERRNNKKRMRSPMSERSHNVQDVFLNYVRKNRTPVTVFLVNGVKLQGAISGFDNFCVLLKRDAHIQLVYKHAISTVMPATPVQLYDPAEPESATTEA